LIHVPAGAVWLSCQSLPAAAIIDDAGADGADDGSDASFTQDASECNPCVEVCRCTIGDTLDSNGCTVLFCATGMWGGQGCTPTCDESGAFEAGSDGPAAADGPSDGHADADGHSDAGAAADGSSDALADGATLADAPDAALPDGTSD
jgi:hypothetical protein